MTTALTLGVVGAGRMGGGIVRRLLAAGQQVAVTDVDQDSVTALEADGAQGLPSIAALVATLPRPRAVWVMVPAGTVTTAVIEELAGLLEPGDVIIDGGNSRYTEAMGWSRRLKGRGIDFLDVGTSGGVWGRERGFCLMIGGDPAQVTRLEPVWDALCPGVAAAPRTVDSGPVTSAEKGWLHCGPSGAGHFVKMIHNGIEYGAMAAYAEGLNILAHANAGSRERAANAETAPLANAEDYQFDFDLAAITEVWRRGSVVASWLLDLTAAALRHDPTLSGYQGRVSDSGEGRWTVDAAVDVGVPAPVLAASLFSRFASRDNDDMANKVLSAMRHAFGGHLEQTDH